MQFSIPFVKLSSAT